MKEYNIIDNNVLDALRTLETPDGKNLAKYLIDMFVDEHTKIRANMTQNFINADWEELARIAHTYKSSSGNIGLVQLSHAMAELEKLCRMKNFAESRVKELVSEIDETLTRSVEKLKEVRDEH